MPYQREYEKRITIGIVGVGKHCYRNLLPALHYLPVRLAAVCDTNEELAKVTAAQYGCNYYTKSAEMYEREQLDAVLLCVSAQLHPQLAIEAFDAGLHVWMEKPVAMRAYEVERMIEHRGDRVSVAGFKKAFMPSTDKAVEVVQSAEFGALLSMLAVYPMTLPENGAEVLEKGYLTNWIVNGCHPLSLMLRVGGPVESVIAHRDKNGGGVCLLQFANGVTGNFHLASGPHPLETYRFFGTDWNLNIDNSLRVTLQRGIPFEYNRTHHYAPEGFDHGTLVWEPQNCLATLENKALFTQGIYGELAHFCECILEGRPAEKGSLEFALELMKVSEAALISDGKRIDIQ